MTGQPSGTPGAAPTTNPSWKAINWSHHESLVRRLQVRIAKAAKDKRWGKVKSLQRILVTSWSAKALAVRRVTKNKGKNTPGIDRIIWRTTEAKFKAIQALQRRGYKAQPLRRVLIPKGNGKQRKLGIPTMNDRAMQALHAMALSPIAETLADHHSYGFRPRRSVADAIRQGHIVLSRKVNATWVLEGDIKACFDRIDHGWLMDNIPMDKSILQQWLNAGYIHNNVLNATNEGTPQGGLASPILANMALDGLQKVITEAAPKGAKVNFIRYADDFICTGKSREVLRDIIMPVIHTFLEERGLALSEEKTHITHIREGFDFLGSTFRKFKDKLVIRPNKEKTKGFLQRLKKDVRGLRYKKAAQVIPGLNRKLRGWANFYRALGERKVFSTIDHVMFKTIWRELKRRHPKKNAKWIRNTYFTSIRRYNWTFFGVETKGDRRRPHYLFQMSSTRMVKHIKIRSKCNPFDKDFDAYLSKRTAIQIAVRRSRRLKSFPTLGKWQRYPKGQLELFEVGLREQP